MVKQKTVYDEGLYNTFSYGRKGDSGNFANLFYGVCPVGIEIRKQLGHLYIFRRRHGNGYAGSVYKKIYQDKYNYIVPSSINNAQGQHARDIMSAAVAAWQLLPENEKNFWRKKEYSISGISGYNLFIKNYFLYNY